MTPGRERPDLRLPGLGLAVWLGCLAGRHLVPPLTLAAGICLGLVLGWLALRRRLGPFVTAGAALVVLGALVTVMRVDVVRADRLDEVVGDGGHLRGRAVVTSDPVAREGHFGDYVVVRLRLQAVAVRSRWRSAAAPVLVFAPPSWAGVRLGSTVAVAGTFSPSTKPEIAGTLSVRSAPDVLDDPAAPLRAAGWVRRGIREAASVSDTSARELVPALVVGDDARLAPHVVQDFRVAGLTHLTAVSGTNLTLVVGSLLSIARALGVRGRVLGLVGALGVIGFVLAARPEPSVLRAAVMGSVALMGMWSGATGRGVRALGAAVLVLLLLDPWLAVSVGFALSVLATAGILLVAPPVAAALSRWMPRWLAETLAVPFAAQLACTPVVAAISQQVSLVAVIANLLAGLAVGPATVLGMLGGLTAPVVPVLGHLAGRLACWCADWILLVGERAAQLPGAAVGWSADVLGLSVLTVLCVAAAIASPRLARRPAPTAVAALVVGFLLVHPLHVRWAPEGWFLVMCDVGQGDGLVIRTGEREAVVVDTGPDAETMGRCLDDLQVESVPLLVLTHFHADHVDGIASVIRDRPVGEIWVSGTPLPPEGSAVVAAEAARAGVPVEVPRYGSRRTVGGVVLEVVSPGSEPRPDAVDDGAGTTPNNASVVLSVATPHVTALLTGDVEPEAQRGLARVLAGRTFDVLKVPHHGSARQDLGFLRDLGAGVALVSVGADNDYGHPDGALIDALGDWGVRVARTDLDGAVALTWDGALHLVREGR